MQSPVCALPSPQGVEEPLLVQPRRPRLAQSSLGAICLGRGSGDPTPVSVLSGLPLRPRRHTQRSYLGYIGFGWTKFVQCSGYAPYPSAHPHVGPHPTWGADKSWKMSNLGSWSSGHEMPFLLGALIPPGGPVKAGKRPTRVVVEWPRPIAAGEQCKCPPGDDVSVPLPQAGEDFPAT